MSINPNILESYQALEHNKQFYKDCFVINWTFFTICNYSCSYCVPLLYDGKYQGLPLPQVLRFIDRIFELKPNKKIIFEFTGGEITFYKHFTELFEYIKNQGGYTGIISNGSQKVEWWKKHAHLIDHANLSFHSEKGDPDHFFEVITTIHGKLTQHINIMMLPEKFDMLLELGSKIAAQVEGVSVAIQPLFYRFSGPMFKYTPEQLQILHAPNLPYGQDLRYQLPEGFQNKAFRGEMRQIQHDGTFKEVDPTLLIANQENIWFGWNCWTGVENLVIDAGGTIVRGICGMGGVIGSILEDKLELPTKPVTCLKKRCTCAFDIMCTKTNTLV